LNIRFNFVLFVNFVVIFLFHLLSDKLDDVLPVCIITLTHCAIFFIKDGLGCVSLIGNPVKIGSGPAAVTPAFRCKAGETLLASIATVSIDRYGKVAKRAGKPEDLP
jgi:hypothetical protein